MPSRLPSRILIAESDVQTRASRIIAVADVCDAMPSNRPYLDALAHDDADATVTLTGTRLDPDVVRRSIRMTESRAC